ncbi:MAG: helix-turn-helix transcriptional regulator [Clostridia bacterium]|nr:helix-turn-helix transcriptional regulator [Clostridia bacterium]
MASCKNINLIIARNLKRLRLKNHLTQNQFCEKLRKSGFQIARNTYTKYESGTRTVPYDVLLASARFYNVSLEYLLTNESEDS